MAFSLSCAATSSSSPLSAWWIPQYLKHRNKDSFVEFKNCNPRQPKKKIVVQVGVSLFSIKSESKDYSSSSSSSSSEEESRRKSRRLEIGSPIIVTEAPKMIKTATAVPCLRLNSGLVNPGDVGSRRNGNDEWNLAFRRALFQWEIEDLRRLKIMLLNAPAIREGMIDRLKWNAEISGVFTVSSAYKWSAAPVEASSNVVGCIWKSLAPPKVQFFGWLAWKWRIKTASYLQRIGILSAATDTNCVFCRDEVEDINHVLLSCPFIWRIWSNIINWWGVYWATPGSVSGLLQWWMGLKLNKKELSIWKVIPLAVLWYIWKQRNESIFKGSPVSFEGLCDSIKVRVAVWVRTPNSSCTYSIDDIVYNLKQVRFSLRG